MTVEEGRAQVHTFLVVIATSLYIFVFLGPEAFANMAGFGSINVTKFAIAVIVGAMSIADIALVWVFVQLVRRDKAVMEALNGIPIDVTKVDIQFNPNLIASPDERRKVQEAVDSDNVLRREKYRALVDQRKAVDWLIFRVLSVMFKLYGIGAAVAAPIALLFYLAADSTCAQ